MLGRLLRFRKNRSRATERELRGRPKIRREKVHAADSGYVYQYTYEGFRPVSREQVAGREYVFHCTVDRVSRFPITLFAPAESFSAWERRFDRDLNEVERYAVVKMWLFEVFDEYERIAEAFDDVLTPEQVERHVETLDL